MPVIPGLLTFYRKWLLGCSRKVERSHWTRWTQLSVSLTNWNYSNGIMLTFDPVFHYLVSHYWVPQCPPYYMYGKVIIPSWWWVWTSDLPESVGGSNIIFYLPRKVSEAINFSRSGHDNIYCPVFQKLSDWYVSLTEDCPGKIVWISS